MVKKRLVLIVFCLIVLSSTVSSIDHSAMAAQNCIYSLSIYSLTANDCNLDNLCPIRDANCKGTEANVIALCNEIKNEYGVLNRDKLDECWRYLAEINLNIGRSKEGGPCEVENPTACDKAWAGKTMWDELVAAGLDGECKIKNEERCQEAHKKREEAEKECYGGGGVGVYISQFNQALNSLVECNKQVYESTAKACYENEEYNRVVENNLKSGASAKRKIVEIIDQMKNKGFSFTYGGIIREITWAEDFDKEIIKREDKLNEVINELEAAQLEKEIRWFEEDKSWYENKIIPVRTKLVDIFKELRPLEEGFNVWAEVNSKWDYLWDNLDENMGAHDWTELGLLRDIKWFYGFVQVRNLKIEELNKKISELKQKEPDSPQIKENEEWIVRINEQISITNQVIKLKEERAELEDKRNMLREEFVEQRKQEAEAIMEDVKAIWAIKGTCQRIGETKKVENSGVEQEDLCTNGKQDSSEEGIDCGGSCMQRCSYDLLINPNSVTLTADGKDSKEFILTAKSSNAPLKNEKFTVSFWFPFNSKLMSDYGRISPTSITTDETGKARFTYYAPRAPDGTYLKNLNFEIRATGKSGAKTKIHLVDPKPRVKISLNHMSLLEGNEVNYADVEIIDEDSKEWDIKVTTSIGTLIGDYGEVNYLTKKIQTKKYDFSWNPPKSAVELIDGTIEYIKDHKNDWSSYESGLKSTTVNAATDALVGGNIVRDTESQIGTWNGNVNQMRRDVNRIQTSTSSYETFLRSISFALEGLQAYYGTKGFFDDKLGDGGSEGLKAYLEGLRDKTIDYGVDSLQSGLRYWANLVREGDLDTIRIPVNIVVEVTDEDGFKTKESKVFQYTYHVEWEKKL